jgi:hypothetical protein
MAVFDTYYHYQKIAYRFVSWLSREGWRFAKQILPDLDNALTAIMERGLWTDLFIDLNDHIAALPTYTFVSCYHYSEAVSPLG